MEAVLDLHRLFGAPDYFMRGSVADLETYERCPVQKVSAIPGIRKASLRFTMKVLKSTCPERKYASPRKQ
ncbi:MAG: Lrp/AsnC family transcriptional regulator [Corynebacterium sp.]|nr:Lrp/AsnC family transcriptional regulator [Corynebacterium sp.]